MLQRRSLPLRRNSPVYGNKRIHAIASRAQNSDFPREKPARFGRIEPPARLNRCSARPHGRWSRSTNSLVQKKTRLAADLRRPHLAIPPNLKADLSTPAYEKDFLSFNDRARHYWRAFFCYGYFPGCIRALHDPFTLSDAEFRNTEF